MSGSASGVLVVFLCFLFSGCAGSLQNGQASWYGGQYHGRKTASGEIYNKRSFTAAHRTLAFGTVVRVTHKKTGRFVVVRINDRGPFGKKSRIVDLSEAAAEKLGILRAGVAAVSIEVLQNTEPVR